MWLWFLTHSWDGEWKNLGVAAKNTCVVGPRDTAANDDVFTVITASELEHSQKPPAVQHFLNNLPADASIFVHFDVDVLRDSVMPAAYSPNPNSVDLRLTQQTLRYILSDSRVRGIEITEFCPTKDRDGSAAQLIVDLLRSSFPDI